MEPWAFESLASERMMIFAVSVFPAPLSPDTTMASRSWGPKAEGARTEDPLASIS